MAGTIFVDKANSVGYAWSPENNRKSWTLPKSYKNQISLGQAQLGATYFESKLTSLYQATNPTYLLKANKNLTYDHLAGYYAVINLGASHDFSSYKLTEVNPPIFRGEKSNLDLAVNSTIQSDLPEIQQIVQDILTVAKTRKDQIAGILKYLSLNYTYDYEMVEKDKVRSLSTKEALDRKKGVCQHYAVLYTAIARALKIPTRIVVGYAIHADQVGMHAWVESEVAEGFWQVIEPQSPNGLTGTLTRYYFPLMRGSFLEDMKAPTTSYGSEFYNSKFTAEPVQ